PHNRRSFLGYTRLTKPGKISALCCSGDLRHPPVRDGSEACDGRIAIVTDQLAGFSQLGDGAFGVTVQGICRSEERTKLWMRWGRVARLLVPNDRLYGPRLQQMRGSDPAMK